MKSIISTALVAAFWLGRAFVPAAAQQPTDDPAEGLTGLKTPEYLGCFSSPGKLVDMGEYTFQAMGWCQPLCVRQAKPILALYNGQNCFCGDDAPPQSAKVDDSECNKPCVGFPKDKCGGADAYMVYHDQYQKGDPTGTIHIEPPKQTATTKSTPLPTPIAQTTTDAQGSQVIASTVFVTAGGHPVASVISITQTAQPTATPGPNKAAIAAGVVAGLVALAGLIGGLVFYMRYKKNKALEEERQRHEAITSLVNGEKPPSTYSLADSRLEPSVMFQRRQSDGSIMDNQDYSRRILKVTNPDDR